MGKPVARRGVVMEDQRGTRASGYPQEVKDFILSYIETFPQFYLQELQWELSTNFGVMLD